jgi:hypothetical protein
MKQRSSRSWLCYLTSNEVADVYLYLVLYPPPSMLKPVATNAQPNGSSPPLIALSPLPAREPN